MKFNIGNQEIKEWFESRDWLTHYSGDGRAFNANFVTTDGDTTVEEIKTAQKCPSTELPWRIDNDYSTIYLDKESYYTWAFPRVHVMIHEAEMEPDSEDPTIYDLQVHFAHLRAGDEYEQVFRGYVTSLDELLMVFSLLGVESRYLAEPANYTE